MEDGALWASLPVPAVLIDARDRIAGVNAAGEAFLNASAKALIGLPVQDRLRFDTDLNAAFARVRRDDGPVFVNRVGVGQVSGGACDLRIAPVVGSAGDVLMLIEPRHLADRLGEGQGVRSAARSAIGMAEMLAHEIKNPLAGITGAAQLLAMELAGEDRELTDLIVAESRRIVALLDQVEEFGNLRPPARAVANVHDLLDRARKSAEVGFAARMRFVEEYDPSLPPTFVDADQIIQVFLNLIRNAAEVLGPGGAITVSIQDGINLNGRQYVEIAVADNGPGLPDHVRAKLFQPTVSTKGGGHAGLGLAIVKSLAEELGGQALCRPNGGGGSMFIVLLPIY